MVARKLDLTLYPHSTLVNRIVALLWVTALLVALGNVLIVTRRLPVQRRLANDAEEQTVQEAARWLRKLPTDARALTVVSAQDALSYWFRCRLTYLTLPARLNLLETENLPVSMLHEQADALLLYGVERSHLPVGWQVVERAPRAFLAIRRSHSWPPSPDSDAAETAAPFPLSLRILNALLSLAVIVLFGGLALGTTLRSPPFAFWWANLALAHVVGAALVSLIGTVEIAAQKPLSVVPVYGLLFVSLFAFGRTRRILFPITPRRAASEIIAEGAAIDWRQWLLCGLIVLGIVTALERFWLIGVEWDGFMIWQMKAKAFFYDGSAVVLRQAIHFPEGHLDYPLLIPINTWWTMAHFGAASVEWGRGIGFLFYLDTLTLFAALARPVVGRQSTLIGIALLASAPFVTEHAVSGYADLAFAAYFLALGGCLLRWQEYADAPRLAGLLLVGTVLTKNEGLLGCLAFLATASALAFVTGEWRARGKSLAMCVGVVLLAYLPWFLVKQRWHLANDVLQMHPHVLTPAFLLARLWQTLISGFVRHSVLIGPWMPAWGLLLLLLPVGLYVTLKRRVTPCIPLWLFGGLQLLGYLGIYLITPFDLHKHIESSIDRLILHVVPLMLLAALIGSFARSDSEETAHGKVNVSEWRAARE